LAAKAGVDWICFMSNLFKVPASLRTISSVAAGCAANSVAPVILDTSKPEAVTFVPLIVKLVDAANCPIPPSESSAIAVVPLALPPSIKY